MSSSAQPTSLVHIYVVQDQQFRTKRLMTCALRYQAFRRELIYRRITEHPINRLEARALVDQLKQDLKLGELQPISYFESTAGMTHRVRQVAPRSDASV